MNVVTFADVFIGLSERLADRVAVESPKIKLTYREMVDRAARSADELHARGVLAGDRVGVSLRDSAEALVLTLAVWILGGVVVPIDFRARPGERASLFQGFGLRTIVEDRSGPPTQNYSSIIVDQSWTDVISGHRVELDRSQRDPAPAFIALTSGTTGQPLGAVVDHERLLARVMLPLELGRKDAGGRLFNPISLSFGLSIHNTLTHMLNGGTVIFFSPLFGAEELAEAVASSGATSVCAVPTIARDLLDLQGSRALPMFNKLNLFYCSGSPMLAEEKRQAKERLTTNFVELYASQLGGRISFLDSSDIDDHADTVGRILPQVSLQIVDEADKLLPVGEAGIIRVRSPGMARTVLQKAERASGDRLKDGWVYTGEIGAVTEEGFLRLLGRDSDVIIRGGENVHPGEIESVLLECPGVSDAAVVGHAVLREGEEIVAFVVARENVSEMELTAHFWSRLAPNKRPRRIIFTPVIPRNVNGKVLYANLRKQLSGEE
jgi:acyl-CoA synthetase (AMP-forming)/AMP-acid ligase II